MRDRHRHALNSGLLKRIADGDVEAVRECMEAYGALVWSMARRLSRSIDDAEDATQEIFLHVWRSASLFDESKGSEQVFIAVIARRRLIDRLRKLSAEPHVEFCSHTLETLTWSDPCASSEDCLEAELAKRALEELRPEQRQVLELGLLDGLTQSEIAARLGMPLGTVKSSMRRGITRVREYMNIGAPRVAGDPDV